MSTGEIISLAIAVVSLLTSAGVSVFAVRYFNNKKAIYEIKKNAIFRSLRFLDDYVSHSFYVNGKKQAVEKSNLSVETLTVEARECYNELLLTCKDNAIIELFKQIIAPPCYGMQYFNLTMLNDFRQLGRKELGLKSLEFDNKVSFIAVVGCNNNQLNKNQ